MCVCVGRVPENSCPRHHFQIEPHLQSTVNIKTPKLYTKPSQKQNTRLPSLEQTHTHSAPLAVVIFPVINWSLETVGIVVWSTTWRECERMCNINST